MKLDPVPEQVHQLIQAFIQEDLLFELARSIRHLPFEARKDTQTIFSHLLRFRLNRAVQGDPPVVTYIVNKRPEILVELCHGYDHAKSAMPCGSILREALKYEVIAAIIFYDESKPGTRVIRLTEIQLRRKQSGDGVFWKFFQWINKGSFEVSADAFTTFRVSIRPIVKGWFV
ncbi:hypothetical protein KEM55_001125 [Ascosphaera atra]|nr:hypothetical protein KEM55_001125 [Ascosphaera atra]